MAGSISAVGLDDHTTLALRLMHWPSNKAGDPGDRSQPLLRCANAAHGARSVPVSCLPMRQVAEKILEPIRVC